MTTAARGGLGSFVVDPTLCIGCGVSSSVAPHLVHLGGSGKAEVRRQPCSSEEVHTMETAALLCPVGAISREGPS